jgi:hypothetical protein
MDRMEEAKKDEKKKRKRQGKLERIDNVRED